MLNTEWKSRDYMKKDLYRSRLVIPVNEFRFIEKAHTRNADLFVLDLEDSVPNEEKETARGLVTEAVETMKQNDLTVYIRINNDENIEKDLLAVIRSKADGILLPKAESSLQIFQIEKFLKKHMETERFSTFKISILIESVKGCINLQDILSCSKKIDTASYGMEDLAAEIDFTYREENERYLDYLRMNLIMLSKLYNVKPLGLIGSITNFKDLDSFKLSADKAYSIGYEGSSCIHPNQVAILNDAFKPSDEKLQEMRELVEVFEDAISKGRASATFQGKMIDYPHYDSAQKLLEKYDFDEGSA